MKEKDNAKVNEQKKLIQELFSTDENSVMKSIQFLRDKGGVFIVEPLIEVYFSTQYESVRDSVYNLICDLKDNKTADVFANNIEKYSTRENFSKLLSAFWQSSIKFSELLPFIKLFVKSDNLAAVEIFTIVEQNICNVSDEDKMKCDKLITSKISELEGFKRDIAKEILVMLK
ncbi:MAG TPA: hypothetical protein PLL66_02415 [Bacteroidales bacterium]|nr:hypothetical protein [Bacteroidales bacterium]